MPDLKSLKVKLFADGADLEVITRMAQNPLIKGFTTNPTLMRKANILDYKAFALDVLQIVPDRPVSFEVFSDDFLEMERQAFEIASWGENVYVKVPVTNTLGEFAGPLIKRLSTAGVQVNVTALMTVNQVERVVASLADTTKGFISIFAGRIADTGLDPVPTMVRAVEIMKACPRFELIWASPRELLNVFQADAAGCHVITATNDVLSKLNLVGKDLDEFSLETVKMFYRDALNAGYTIEMAQPEPLPCDQVVSV
ncbi:MAG: transaldolase [Leptolyngbyaceae cyanobacterium bins.59]|nr:transaldolase [Leptolyngbyaceae cyanobacterium bins.59]